MPGRGIAGLVVPKVFGTASGSSNGTVTISFTVPSLSNRMLKVCVGEHQGTVSNVTYGGVSLTKEVTIATAFNETAEIWGMVNPPVGTANVVVTRSGGDSNMVGVVGLYDCKQSLATTTASAQGTVSTSTLPITTTANGSIVLDCICGESVFTNSVGQDQNFNVSVSSYQNTAGASKLVNIAGTTSTSWTLASSQRRAHVSLVVEPIGTIELKKFDSFQFNGIDQFADIPDNAAYSIPTTGALTVSVWLKQYTNQFTLYEGSGYVNVLGKSDFGSPNHCEWQMRLYNLTNTETDMRGNESSFYVFNSTGGTGVSSDYMRETTDVGRWVNYIATMDGTYVTMYKDGVAQEIADYATFPITPADTIAKIYVAHADNNGYFCGEVGPIKIWNRVLNNDEIDAQKRLNSSNTNGLVGHWIADGVNNRLSDQTATANHGTLRNSPTFISNSLNQTREQSIRSSVYLEQSMYLNGSQYATINDASQTGLDVDDKDFLITGWVKFTSLASVQTILAKVDTAHANAGTANAIGYDLIYNTSGSVLSFRTRSGASGNQTASCLCPNDGGFHHVAVVFKRGSSGRCQVWVDGKRKVNFSSFAFDMGNDGPFRFGSASGSGATQNITGYLKNWYFYTWTAGTMPADYQNIIDDVYKFSSTKYTNGLVSIWRFNGNLNDGYGTNNLTGTGTPTFASLTTRQTV